MNNSFLLNALPVHLPRQVSKSSFFSSFFRRSFWNRFGVDFGSFFRRFSGLKSQEISSKNRVCFLILCASGFLSFFRGPNLENRCFSLVKQRFSRNLRFRFSSIFLSKFVSIFDDFCHEKSVKTDLKNTRAFLRCFSHFFRRFWLSFWTLGGAKRGQKRGKKGGWLPEGSQKGFGSHFGRHFGWIWAPWDLLWEPFGASGGSPGTLFGLLRLSCTSWRLFFAS